jgi:hypothetical protein
MVRLFFVVFCYSVIRACYHSGQKLLEMLEGRKGPERVLTESASGGSGLQGYTVHVCLRWEDKTKPTLLTHISKYDRVAQNIVFDITLFPEISP